MTDALENTVDIQRQETVARILDTAERLFRHYGYAKTNVADIAKDLGMSPANIYRFFASKTEIHQALCARMLEGVRATARQVLGQKISATERLRQWIMTQHKITVETMLDHEKVHEIVVIAMERDWSVIDRHINYIHDLMADVIREGIALGEFREQDAFVASRCFGAATILLCHPLLAAQCLAKTNQAAPEQILEYALRSLK
jgi:AcrR family transcriptional regulator